MAFTKTWDETKPAGGRARSLGDDDMREFKYAMRERLAKDHYFYADESGHGDVGFHKQVTFAAPLAADPTEADNYGFLYTKDVDSKAELHWLDEDGNVIQMTSGGDFVAGMGSEIRMYYGTIANIPTGWVFCNGSNSTPDMRDRFAVCAKQDDGGVAKTNITGSLLASGGDTTHTHGVGSFVGPNHTHTIPNNSQQTDVGWDGDGVGSKNYTTITHNHGGSTGSSGTGAITGTSAAGTHIPSFYALAFMMKS